MMTNLRIYVAVSAFVEVVEVEVGHWVQRFPSQLALGQAPCDYSHRFVK